MTSITRRGPGSTGTPPVDDLRAMNAGEREALLAGLVKDKDRDGLRHVLEETNAVTLRQTLEVSAKRGSLGALVEALGLDDFIALGKARGVEVNEVLASTDSVKERGLTAKEAQRVRENFGHTLDPDTIRLVFTKGAQTMGAGAMALGNTVHVDPSDPRFGLERGTTRPADGEDDGWGSFNTLVLGHEAAHVWSYQHRGSTYAFTSVVEQTQGIASTGSRDAAYGYQPDRPSFWAYGEEQRAMLVQDYVAAFRAKKKGQATTPTTYGGWLPVDEVVKTLTPFITQMRAAGPGQPHPPEAPSPLVCTGLGFVQDGLADFVARSADRAIAGVGSAAKDAVVEGVTKSKPGQVAAGAAGLAAAGVASVVSREQNATGARGGGSALLDQAGLPRGVEVKTKDGVRLGVKGAWDAPRPEQGQPLTVGASNARVEWHVGADVPVGDEAQVSADARATVGLDGKVQEASAEVGVKHPKADVKAGVKVKPPRAADAPLRVDAALEVTTEPVSVTADAHLEVQHGEVQRADVSARVDAKVVSGGADVSLRRGRDGLELEQAQVDVELAPSPDVAVGLRGKLVPQGVDGLAASIAAKGDKGSVAVEASVKDLTKQPTVGVAVTATPKGAPVSVTVQAETTPQTGATSVGVGIKGKF
ncbi:MAG: hypothetical protein IT380_27140 [Myxococcales bacterium]|nr:hypothetical protein [Myxococcales bacterium]